MPRLSVAGAPSAGRQTGPGGAYSPSSAKLKARGAPTHSAVKYVIGVTVAEIILLGCLRRAFHRYHGG